MTKVEQLRGDEALAEDASLFERLGGASGVRAIVEDFVRRIIADPRANWERKGVKKGGVLGIGAETAEWKATAENLAVLEDHLAQFIAVATGGPALYEGRDLKEVHAGMQVTNAEFDASIGALQATMDALQIRLSEQKELLAVFESTRAQIAEER